MWPIFPFWRQQKNSMLKLRCFLFYIVYLGSGFWFGLSGFIVGLIFPYSIAAKYIVRWNHLTLFFARHLLKINVELLGRENLPDYPCVIMSKHQSQFETFFLQTLFAKPLCTILKIELLRIPFFGWGLAKLQPIAIDRSKPKEALQQVLSEGIKKVQQGRSILIFPEGTRVSPGQSKRYAKGGAELAIAANVNIVPIAHNAGHFWPADEFIKHSGTITFSIGAPISSQGKSPVELINEVQEWVESESARLAPAAGNQAVPAT